jgi:hypothetical protein
MTQISNRGDNTYAERQTVRNTAEFLFEYYCAEKEYELKRIGFDEKNNAVSNFFRLNKCLRNIPDYIVNTPTKTFVVNVKGTGNFKAKEIALIPELEAMYGSKEAPLIYAFCFVGQEPKLLYPSKIVELYNKAQDRQWPDGVIYRNLGL